MIFTSRARHRQLGHLLSTVLVIMGVLASACTAPTAVPTLDLSERSELPEIGPTAPDTLRIGIAAILAPESNIETYRTFADHLSRRLERPVALVQRRTYAEINALLADGDIDIAFVCTSAYVVGHDEFGLTLLAVPEVDGATVYHSEIIVHRDSAMASVDDLRGSVFAFTDPMSTSGRLYPTFVVRGLGFDPDTFFSRTFFTYSHENAIRSVAAGVADGAAVDSLVLDFVQAQESDLPVRVIHRSPAFAMPPVVAAPHLDPEEITAITQLLLSLDEDAATRVVLDNMGVDRFVPADDGAYAGVRGLIDALEEDA